jgi:hypothetical protein
MFTLEPTTQTTLIHHLCMKEGGSFVLLVCHVEISQTIVPFATREKPSMTKGALS